MTVQKIAGLPYSQARQLVVNVAFEIPGAWQRRVDLEDVLQDGFVGLLDAASRFRPGAGTFPGLARPRIRGAILDAIRKRSFLSRDTVLLIKRSEIVWHDRAQALGRQPTDQEMADGLGLTLQHWLDHSATVVAAQPGRPFSHLDEDDADLPLEPVSLDLSPFDYAVKAEQLLNVVNIVRDRCTRREQLLFNACFGQGQFHHEIAAEWDLDESRVSQILSGALTKVRRIARRGKYRPRTSCHDCVLRQHCNLPDLCPDWTGPPRSPL